MKRTTVTLTDELASRLQLEAERRQTSVSEVMRILVAEALGVAPEAKRRIPFAALFDDPEMVPGEDIDQELEGEWLRELDRDRG